MMKIYNQALINEGFPEEQAFVLTLHMQDSWFTSLWSHVEILEAKLVEEDDQ